MANYLIIGGDQKEYGPITTDDVRKWIAEGRLNAQSRVKAESDAEWRPLSAFPEFADVLAAPGGAPAATTPPPLAAPGASAAGVREAALALVKGPALALMIIAGLGIAYYAFSGLAVFIGGGTMFHRELPAETPPQLRAFVEGMHGPLAGLINLLIAAWNGFILFGAIKLWRLQNHTLATVAAVAAMLPCQCCCVFGLPFGIWAMVVLNKPEVKSQFA